MGCRVHHIHHVAREPRAAASFYQKHFGATIHTPEMEYMGAPYISVSLAGLEIRIRGLRPNESAEMVETGRGLNHFGIQVDRLDAFAAALEKGGVEFTKRPGPGVLGSRTAFIKAPDGVLIELVEEPRTG